MNSKKVKNQIFLSFLVIEINGATLQGTKPFKVKRQGCMTLPLQVMNALD